VDYLSKYIRGGRCSAAAVNQNFDFLKYCIRPEWRKRIVHETIILSVYYHRLKMFENQGVNYF
jgi:hypothetical protein